MQNYKNDKTHHIIYRHVTTCKIQSKYKKINKIKILTNSENKIELIKY